LHYCSIFIIWIAYDFGYFIEAFLLLLLPFILKLNDFSFFWLWAYSKNLRTKKYISTYYHFFVPDFSDGIHLLDVLLSSSHGRYCCFTIKSLGTQGHRPLSCLKRKRETHKQKEKTTWNIRNMIGHLNMFRVIQG
jgi:hypothetical protein